MDAKPYRPRGAENARPALHQRHKSTSNLASFANAPAAGFRGPAKRAAFGDVTNVSRLVGGSHDSTKPGKQQNTAVPLQKQSSVQLNKENVPLGGRDALPRPAQRPAVLTNKLSCQTDTQVPQAVHRDAPKGVADQPSAILTGQTQQTNADAIANPEAQQSVQGGFEAPALQPRHHKSQPQLNAHKPSLRRTQSRQLEKTDPTLDESVSSVAMPQTEDVQILDPPVADVSKATVDAVSSADHVRLTEVNHSQDLNEAPNDDHTKESGIQEEAVSSIIPPQKDMSGRTQSELGEYWEEEEYEEYDEQDQAYTTAHSLRSRDLTTGGATTLLAPRITSRIQRELEEAKVEVEGSRSHEDVDEEMWDVSMVAEYGEEIFEYMRELEIKLLPDPHYMDIQTEIQWSMRSILMDWLVQVHGRFNLLPETLFLTVNYIDRFLSCKVVSMGKLQLVGATAILVASKYEEINCPSLQEIIYMVDGGYTMEEILKAERFMLSMLGFELGWPGPMSFLRRVSKADDYDLETRTLAKYFLELTIMDERFVASPPSFLAAGAHCLSRLILNKGDWTKAHVHYSGYTWGQLRPLITMMIGCCETPDLHHRAVYLKYTERRFKEASLRVQDALSVGFTIPHCADARNRSSTRPFRLASVNTEQLYQPGVPVPIET